MARIVAVCVGDVKGGPKRRVGQAQLVKNFGLSGDADSGALGRQVSLLSTGLKMAPVGEEQPPGSKGENLAVSGLDLASIKPGTTLRCGDALLEFVGPIEGTSLYQAKVRLAGIVTEGDQLVIEHVPA
ncbi:MAG: hypothetical protein LBE31_05585 [Deltaproteobacteria bacterium]|jgi:hypothetical protein|nr:hypothetical protein [Deltaproteobacteria bacterium]